MARVQALLNGLWTYESDGVQWFDPSRNLLYPDRIRRRPPGTDSAGLGTHLDPGTLDLWMTQGYQTAFRHLFDGTVEQYDPWDAAHRPAASAYLMLRPLLADVPDDDMCGVTVSRAFPASEKWHPPRLVPPQRAVRPGRWRGLPVRVQPQRLPGRTLRAHLGKPIPGPRPQRNRATRSRL